MDKLPNLTLRLRMEVHIRMEVQKNKVKTCSPFWTACGGPKLIWQERIKLDVEKETEDLLISRLFRKTQSS